MKFVSQEKNPELLTVGTTCTYTMQDTNVPKYFRKTRCLTTHTFFFIVWGAGSEEQREAENKKMGQAKQGRGKKKNFSKLRNDKDPFKISIFFPLFNYFDFELEKINH